MAWGADLSPSSSTCSQNGWIFCLRQRDLTTQGRKHTSIVEMEERRLSSGIAGKAHHIRLGMAKIGTSPERSRRNGHSLSLSLSLSHGSIRSSVLPSKRACVSGLSIFPDIPCVPDYSKFNSFSFPEPSPLLEHKVV